jgi:hypothetical protein
VIGFRLLLVVLLLSTRVKDASHRVGLGGKRMQVYIGTYLHQAVGTSGIVHSVKTNSTQPGYWSYFVPTLIRLHYLGNLRTTTLR